MKEKNDRSLTSPLSGQFTELSVNSRSCLGLPVCASSLSGQSSSSSSRSSDGNSSLPDEGGSASQVPQASVQLAG